MTTQPETGLVTTKEQLALEQIAKGKAPHSQRAMALLALHEGNAQTQAAEKAGLSAGQVKYWTAKFRKQRLDIFPNDLQDANGGGENSAGSDVDSKSKAEKLESTEAKTQDAKEKNKKKGKKKGKKSDKGKKGKKDKKDKKSKKSKKKSGKAKKGKKSK